MSTIKLNANLDDISLDYPLAPAGSYPCIVSKVEEEVNDAGQSSVNVSFTPSIPVECKVGDKTEQVVGRELFRHTIGPKAMFMLKKLLIATKTPWTAEGFNNEDLIGKSVNVAVTVVQSKDDPSKFFNRVSNYSPAA